MTCSLPSTAGRIAVEARSRDEPVMHTPRSDTVSQSRRVGAWAALSTVLVVAGFAIVFARVVQLKIAPDPRLSDAAGITWSVRDEPARRGDLLDRRGRVIAASCLAYKLFVDPKVVDDPLTIAAELGHILSMDPVEIDRKIMARPNSRYIVISDPLEDWQVSAVEQAGLRGVGLDPRLERHYPNGELGAAIVGMVGFEHTGLNGFEHQFDRTLEPEPGRLIYWRDAHRRPLWIDDDGYRPSADGLAVQLSIDMVIQEIATRNLREEVDAVNAGGGRVVVIDCTSGEILAMCDELRDRPGWTQTVTDPLREVHPALGRNRCVTDPYEPGSTFKPFVWSRATELGLADPDEMFDLPEHTGWRTPYGRLIRDSHYYGRIDWRTILIKSVNTGMAMVAERMSHRQMQQVVHDFGFGSQTKCGLPGETAGIVTPTNKWSKYTQSSVAMGHEIAVTPVQMVRAFSVFARDGTLPALTITATQADERVDIIQRVLDPETARLTRQVLREVMLEGTGRRAQSELYEIFGKSGTAQLPNAIEGGYYEHRYVSSFVGGAPYNNPKIVAICVIDDPDRKINHWGGAIAGPVVRDIIDETLQYLGVPPDKPQVDGGAVAAAE